MNNPFISNPALGGLKDFQRKTVEYVFKRFYGDDPTSRFLIADEVGLGKTLVAKGIIAKTIEHLQHTVKRIDIVYICSNSAIASQNIGRLKVKGLDEYLAGGKNPDSDMEITFTTRLTYLPRAVKDLKKNKVNFISFTPTTTFEHTRSRGGHADERAILYQILWHLPWAHGSDQKRYRNGLMNMLQATVGHDRWRNLLEESCGWTIDYDLSVEFRKAVLSDPDRIYDKLKDCCWNFRRYKQKIKNEDSECRYDLIGKLRNKLASICLKALEPDLVILDEFQRFKNLLDGDDDAAILAKKLFQHPEVRILLLSATPYKMYTLDQENDEDDHYPDFLRTLGFLFDDPVKVATMKRLLSEYRANLHAYANGSVYKTEKKVEIEQMLLKVMCRTERVSTTCDHNSMMTEIEQQADLVPADLQHAQIVDKIACDVNAGEQIEYWKSAPYLINFLKQYELGKKLDEHLKVPSDDLRSTLLSAKGQLLTEEKLEGYQALDPANPRLRVLIKDTIDKEMWKLLWMPPSMPYIRPKGVYSDISNLTKALVFSSWNAVPDAIASICSYEAERKMIDGADVTYSELYKKKKPLLNFAFSSNDNRPTGMPVIAWMLPSPTLANKIDPLKIALRRGDGPINSQELRAEVKVICSSLLEALPKPLQGTRVDERWYWAAPVLLDSHNGLLDWCKSDTGWRSIVSEKEDDEDGKDDKDEKVSHFFKHINILVDMAESHTQLGPRPDDLVDMLCDLALAGPGVCALRALNRIGKDLEEADPDLLSAAARIAWGFRSLYNMPETIALLRGSSEDIYWRLTLQYGIEGNIQSVLDEYVHVLHESLGLQDHSLKEQVTGIAKCIQSVLSLRTAQVWINGLKISDDNLTTDHFRTRSRFALRFGDIRDDNDKELVRADSVRTAFNSPFRPFILASTSIGQEGLDFHTWCHAVVHWNLPSNPVDLEQREGRVHRYKGHAIRKNIAEKYGLNALKDTYSSGDPWEVLFTLASKGKAKRTSDLIPYWIFEEGSAKIERRIPILPFSKEVSKMKSLKKGLALYRLAFGQPRQEDLISRLGNSEETSSMDLSSKIISLEPPEI